MELHKRRRTVTEPEARYFTRQVVIACDYLHKNRVIHRDLKLGNLFLNDEMELRIGDFGLATKVDHDGERKRWVEYLQFIHQFSVSIHILSWNNVTISQSKMVHLWHQCPI